MELASAPQTVEEKLNSIIKQNAEIFSKVQEISQAIQTLMEEVESESDVEEEITDEMDSEIPRKKSMASASNSNGVQKRYRTRGFRN